MSAAKACLPHGEAMLLLRIGLRLSLREAAKLLKLGVVELGAIERDKTIPLSATRLGVAAILLLQPTLDEVAAGGARLQALVDNANKGKP